MGEGVAQVLELEVLVNITVAMEAQMDKDIPVAMGVVDYLATVG
jgi:hypothetical protein